MAPKVEGVLAGAGVAGAIRLQAADARQSVFDDDACPQLESSALCHATLRDLAMQPLVGMKRDGSSFLAVGALRAPRAAGARFLVEACDARVGRVLGELSRGTGDDTSAQVDYEGALAEVPRLGGLSPRTTADLHAVAVELRDLGVCEETAVDEDFFELAELSDLIDERRHSVTLDAIGGPCFSREYQRRLHRHGDVALVAAERLGA